MTPFHRLFSLGTIGTLELPNRLVLPSMATCLAAVTAAVSGPRKSYYVERAKGGAGLLIAENALVNSRDGIRIVNQLSTDLRAGIIGT